MTATAPAAAGNVDTTRAAFTNCLREHLKKQLEAEVGEAEFESSVKAAYTSEREACRTAVPAGANQNLTHEFVGVPNESEMCAPQRGKAGLAIAVNRFRTSNPKKVTRATC
jgi:hypothetical protein